MATHASVCGTLTASVLSASSLCSTRLVRSLGNLHVVAGERDPVFCEQWGSHRDTGSATTNNDTLNNLNMAHLQASSPLTRSEPRGDCACIELDPFSGNRMCFSLQCRRPRNEQICSNELDFTEIQTIDALFPSC